MTYFNFLLQFIGLPLLVLVVLTWLDSQQKKPLPLTLQGGSFWRVLLAHVVVAVVYTTPWDNYLVATGVWWYNPQLVTGVVIGWVPLEEYTFFVVQTFLAGLWWLYLAKRLLPPKRFNEGRFLWRAIPLFSLGVLWFIMALILVFRWSPGTYLALELTWALPPIMLQWALGADILWHYRRLVFTSLGSLVVYLSLADSYAIQMGTWAIDPAQTLGFHLGNTLPLEEFVFFLLTNSLIIFGLTLMLATHSQQRVSPEILRWFKIVIG